MEVEVLDCGEVAYVWGVEGAGVEEEGGWFGGWGEGEGGVACWRRRGGGGGVVD